MVRPGEDILGARARLDWERIGQPDMCTALRLNDDALFTPVRPCELEWNEPGVSVVQYEDPDGEIWGSLTIVDPKVETQARLINPKAGDVWQYYEMHYGLQGRGELDVWYPGTGWQIGGKRTNLDDASQENPVHLLRGDTYRLRASDVGMIVLALYPEVPLTDNYHDTVPVPQQPILSGDRVDLV